MKASPPLRSHAATKNPNFAGYVVVGSRKAARSKTTIVVPDIKKCSSTDTAILPSVSESGSSGFNMAGVFVGCHAGKARYFPALTLNNVQTNYTKLHVRPGDKVVLSVLGTATATTVSVVDKTTTGASKTLTGVGSTSFLSPSVGDGPWRGSGGEERVPNFGTIPFSNSKLNAHPLGSFSPYRLDRYDPTLTTLQIKTTSFASDHASFKTIFKHS